MIDDLRALAVFARTAELGSFRAAAAALGLAPSVVSHHVGRLEERLGVPLLYRTTRRLSLTAEGERLFVAAHEMLEAAERGLGALNAGVEGPSGEIRMTIPGFLDQTAFMAGLGEFLRERPRVRVRLVSSDERLDLVADGFDLAVRVGGLADSGLHARRVATLRRCLVASPRYVADRTTVRAPEDLAGWDFLRLDSRPADVTLLRRDGTEPPRSVPLRARATCTSGQAILALTLADVGFASLPLVLVRGALQVGGLVEVPQHWALEPVGVFLVWPEGARKRTLIALLVDFLAPRLQHLFGDLVPEAPSPR